MRSGRYVCPNPNTSQVTKIPVKETVLVYFKIFLYCPASMTASRCRSSWESLPSSAASRVSGLSWSIAAVPSGSLWFPVSRASPFVFSGSLVQTLVQTGKGVGVSALLLSLATGCPHIRNAEVGSSTLLRPLHRKPSRNRTYVTCRRSAARPESHSKRGSHYPRD